VGALTITADVEGRLRAGMESAVASEQPPGILIEATRGLVTTFPTA
jgi:hypothetical protein